MKNIKFIAPFVILALSLSGCFGKKTVVETEEKPTLVAAALPIGSENKSAIVDKAPNLAANIAENKSGNSVEIDLKNATDPMEKAAVQFEVAMFEMLKSNNKNLLPSKEKPTITTLPNGNLSVVYLEVDHSNVELLVTPSTDPKSAQFIGRVCYIESEYEGIGTNKDDIMKGHFSRIKARRITELARYVNGKWIY